MILYNKLGRYLKAHGMKYIDLQRAIGISPSVMANFQKNRSVTTETIDKICTYLKCQPGEIMEWADSEEQAKNNALQAQIDALQKQLAEVQSEMNK